MGLFWPSRVAVEFADPTTARLFERFLVSGIKFFESHLKSKPRFSSITFIPGRQVPITEELPVDLTGFVLKENHHVHVNTPFNDTQDPPQPILPDSVTHTLTVGDGVVTLTSDPDPATGFTLTAIADATGAFQVKVDAGDSSADPGLQVITGIFEGVVEAGVFVAGITFIPDTQEPNS